MKTDVYLNFNDAKSIASSLGLKSYKQWRKYCQTNELNTSIPKCPNVVYKNKGWTTWMNWLGYSYEGYWNRKYSVNHDYFKTWTPNMAYALGLWWTDGNIFGSRFNITQHKDHKYLLDQILIDMKSQHHISTNNGKNHKNIYRIDLYCKEIVNDIKRLGGIEKKSLKIKFPKIPAKYLPDFVRGLWDGDGSVWETSSGAYGSNFTSGSYKFIREFKKILHKNIDNFHCKIYKEFTERGHMICGHVCDHKMTTYKIALGVNDTIRLRNFMYSTLNTQSIKHKEKFSKFQNAGELRMLKRERDEIYLDFKKARKFVRTLKLNTLNDYLRHLEQNKIDFLPQNPYKRYKYNGWISLQDFLGIQIWNYNEAKEYVKNSI